MLSARSARRSIRLAWLPVASVLVMALGSTRMDAQAPTAGADTARPRVSGVVFANYHYRTTDHTNQFDLERAYLTLSGPLGERTSFRVTADVFRNDRDTVNRSWQFRAKYAYLQYDYLRRAAWAAFVRLGVIQTVFIDYDESFWPRWIAQSPTERHGFFSSADGGIATRLGFPRSRGGVYATITNGPGFASRETDRFKDYAARVTLTPLASAAATPWRSFALSAWAYKGSTASKFARGGMGQLGSIGDGLTRDRWGLHAGVAHPRATVALEYAVRRDEGETGANTSASPRVLTDSSESIAAAYALIRPSGGAGTPGGRVVLVLRWDHVVANTRTDAAYDLTVTGIVYELSRSAAVSLDWQDQRRIRGATLTSATTFFLHIFAQF